MRVAPPPVVTLLKMVSFGDRPSERERDLQDIAHLLDEYVDEASERRWEEAFECGEFDLAPAFLLGLDVGRVAAKDVHRAAIAGFLERVEGAERLSHGVMSSRGPRRWRTEQGALVRRLGSFRLGLSAADMPARDG